MISMRNFDKEHQNHYTITRTSKNTIIIGNGKTSSKRELLKLNWELQEFQFNNLYFIYYNYMKV